MIRALILACGNSLRGDDAVALHVARELRSGLCEPETEIHSSTQWTPELAESISQTDVVIFVDASAVLSPGAVQVRKISPIPDAPGSLSHRSSPAGLLALAQHLYKTIPSRAFLITIGAQSLELSEELSEPVRLAIPEAIDCIKAILSGISLPSDELRTKASSS
ncbi:MAG TPA: hydrogenase maturation protease [Candidatus Dormibacteraeota bacterium]|nr:hydrogenase maturation protease [Candidatus Dormibacteraeota bacterium]